MSIQPRMAFPSPITSMPNEILLRLFKFLAADGSVSSKGARATIGHVCKQWRKISHFNASLWTLITIDAEEYNSQYDAYESDYVHVVPDATFLRQSLYLSNDLSLDIRVTYTTYGTYGSSRVKREYQVLVFWILEVLTRYSIRWRTFEWTGPALFLDHLERKALRYLKSQNLQALTLRCNDQLPQPSSLHSKAIDITLGSGIKHIEVNFDMLSLQPDWSKLTSLTAGFTSASLCHSVLSRATALETLFLTHLGVAADQDPPSAGPTVLPSVRHLKVTPCACATAGFLDQFRFPQIEELSIAQPSEVYASHIISRGQCPNSSSGGASPNYVAMLSTFLQQPGNSLAIRRLNVVWNTRQSLLPLLRLFETSIKALRIEIYQMDSNARLFIQSLVVSKDTVTPLLPNLSELYLHESGLHYADTFHKITKGEVLEDMILSRSALLRVLRLTSMPNTEELKYDRFVQSSLCSTLQRLSSVDVPIHQRLDAEWVLGNFDILREARDYVRTLH